MTVPNTIRELLACPACHGSLIDEQGGERLLCPACLLRFPVRDGIPVMLRDRAERVVV